MNSKQQGSQFRYLMTFKRSGHSYVLAKTEHSEELYFGAIRILTDIERVAADLILRGPGGKIETPDYEFWGRVERCTENSGLQHFARFAVTF